MKALCVLQYILIALMLTACATTVNNPAPVQGSNQVSASIAQEYRIRAGDLLDVKFFYNSELNEQVAQSILSGQQIRY